MTDSDTTSSVLLRALTQLLRPLVRLLLHFNITYPVLSSLLKSVYVEVADRDFPIAGRKQSDSRITLLTGVHRKDVRRLRESGGAPEDEAKTVTLGAQLVARWTGLPEFLDREGRPRPLPRLAGPDEGPGFDTLVQSENKDIRARVVLDEWLRLGIVHLDEGDRVWLNSEAFVPDSGLKEKTWFMGRNLRDHIAACEHNLCNTGAPMMERSVYYDSLTAADIAELDRLARKTGMQALQAVNQRAIALQQASDGKPDAKLRFTYGSYFYYTPDEAVQPQQDEEHTDD